jgi:hypothetical protein
LIVFGGDQLILTHVIKTISQWLKKADGLQGSAGVVVQYLPCHFGVILKRMKLSLCFQEVVRFLKSRHVGMYVGSLEMITEFSLSHQGTFPTGTF